MSAFASMVRLSVMGAAIALTGAGASAMETITVRSGQVAGSPGLPGQPDDIVRYLPGNPAGAPASAFAFTPADFAGAVGGPAAHVITPVGPWVPGISDPMARWVNFGIEPITDWGTSGSALYAVPFFVTTTGITSATLTIELAVDDYLGDSHISGPGPNLDGMYVNGSGLGSYPVFNFGAPVTHTQSITTWVTTGQNYLYLYQRDIGFGASGIIFSAMIEVVPSPGAAALLGLGGLFASRRRR